jgi:hypothetical protein
MTLPTSFQTGTVKVEGYCATKYSVGNPLTNNAKITVSLAKAAGMSTKAHAQQLTQSKQKRTHQSWKSAHA